MFVVAQETDAYGPVDVWLEITMSSCVIVQVMVVVVSSPIATMVMAVNPSAPPSVTVKVLENGSTASFADSCPTSPFCMVV